MTSTPPTASDQRATVVAGFLGWALDAFDFFLVVMTLTAIAKEFGKSDAAIALSITLTLAFRPVGAFIFGLLADRYGRKLPLMIDLVFYSVVEVLTGFAPNYTAFLVLRALSGRRVGAAATGLCVGLSARCVMLPHAVPALRLAAAVLHRRPARAARTVRARAGEGVGGVAGDTARELERTR